MSIQIRVGQLFCKGSTLRRTRTPIPQFLPRSIFCLLFILFAWPAQADDMQSYHALNRRANELDSLSQLPPQDSIVKLVNGTKYAVVIWDSHTEPDNAYFSAMLSVSVPSSNQQLLFVGERIPFSNGSGIKGNARLRLAQDVVVKKGEALYLTFKANETYADIDCNGFQMMSLSGNVELSRNYVVKENADGSIADERVSASFSIVTKDFSDCLLKLSLPTFQIRGLNDFSFSVTNAYLDFSDYANPPGLLLASDYDPTYTSDSSARLWQGLFLEQLRIKLPKFLKKGEEGQKKERLELFTDAMFIDDKGITGKFGAGKLLSLDNGNLGGWSFSLDRLWVQLFKSELTAGGFSGKLALPITGKKDTLGYACTIGVDNSYLFDVRVAQKQLSFPMLKATEVNLFPNSGVQVRIEEGETKICANLSGRITLGANYGSESTSDKLQLDNVRFEELEIANYEPYFNLKGIEYTNAQKSENPRLSNFPITINSIGLRVANKIARLGIHLSVNFTEKMAATGGLSIRASMDNSGERLKFTFLDVGLDQLAINAEIAKLTIKGGVVFFREDTEFGNGFKGDVDLIVDMGVNPIHVKADALFGKKGNNRYWFTDALAEGLNLTIYPPAVFITGFSGGAYEGMSKSHATTHPLSSTQSGQRYVPDSTAGMGFLAGVVLSIVRPKVLKANLMLELAFNTDQSLRRIAMFGEASLLSLGNAGTANELMKKVNDFNASSLMTSQGIGKDVPLVEHFMAMDSKSVMQLYGNSESNQPAIRACAVLDYNFNTNEFLANFNTYVNVLGGVVRGSGPEGSAGPGSIYFGKGDWYLKFGTPDNRISLSVLGMAQFSSYLMTGKSINGSPAPPAELCRILGIDASSLDYMRDYNALGSGKAFAFGATNALETGDRKFLIFYYRVAGGVGFDIMLKDYGQNTYCEGRSGPLGLNGWYANGQAYAYFQGSVGINVKLAFIQGRYEILSLGAAALLQAKLPNPVWLKGTIGGNYSILNGLVKGNCHIDVEFGEQCIVRRQGNELQGIDVIASLTPENNKKDVSVFNMPQAVFNIPVNEPFEIVDVADPSRNKTFRATLQDFAVTEKTGVSVQGVPEWNNDKTVVAFASSEILPPVKDLIFDVSIVFEEYRNGTWQPYQNDKGQIEKESKQIAFTTGVAPETIPLENILYAYPAIGQKNLFKDYGSKGYIQLKRGQSYLFTEANSQLNAKFEVQGTMPKRVDASYNTSAKRIGYQLPDIPLNTVFGFAIVNTPKDNDVRMDKNVKASTQEVFISSDDSESSASVTTKRAEGELLDIEDRVLVDYHFRTSAYPSLTAKLREVTNYTTYYDRLNPVVCTVSMEYGLSMEPFDANEVLGTEGVPPLVQFNLDIKRAGWFLRYMKPLVYNEYPLFGKFTLGRDTSMYGLIPTRNVSVTQTGGFSNLKDAEVMTGKLYGGTTDVTVTGNFHQTMFEDFKELRTQVANAILRESNAKTKAVYHALLMSDFPGISTYRGDTYPVDITYGLPGNTIKTKVITQNIVIR